MVLDHKIKLFRWSFYIIVILCIPIAGYIDYQHWLNPLNLEVEEDPKQHDGSKQFQRPIDFESSVQPAPDEDGTTRYLDSYELHKLGKESDPTNPISPKDQEILDNLKEKDGYPVQITVDQ
jgi:hypothetical protein